MEHTYHAGVIYALVSTYAEMPCGRNTQIGCPLRSPFTVFGGRN